MSSITPAAQIAALLSRGLARLALLPPFCWWSARPTTARAEEREAILVEYLGATLNELQGLRTEHRRLVRGILSVPLTQPPRCSTDEALQGSVVCPLCGGVAATLSELQHADTCLTVEARRSERWVEALTPKTRTPRDVRHPY